MGRLVYRYADRVLAVANGNQGVQGAFLRVIHLLDRPAALLHPRVLLPSWPAVGPIPWTAPPTANSLRQMAD